ncbi:hypothetical protein C3B58_17705, partial [Lactonifactor longoviformis]
NVFNEKENCIKGIKRKGATEESPPFFLCLAPNFICGGLYRRYGHPRMGIRTEKKVPKSPGKSVRKKVYLSPIGGLAKKNTSIYAVHRPIVGATAQG